MLAVRLALRYFISAKSHGAVNVISGISVAGIAVATAAMVIVLSVFNGFTDLTRSRFSAVDPDLMIVPAKGKVFEDADRLAASIAGIGGIEAVTPTLTDRGLIIRNDNTQLGVVFKGIADDYGRVADFDGITEFYLGRPSYDSLPAAAVSVGVASRLDLHAGTPLELFTLRRVGRINPANPAGSFFSASLAVDRIVRIDQLEFDADHIFIPLDVARDLLQYSDGEASALELRLSPGANRSKAIKAVGEKLGPDFLILTREQQHAEAYRMIAVEKWVTLAMMAFILIIAAFNIVSTLSLMVIEKRANMSTMRFMGATRGMVRAVFAWMGTLITVAGGLIGIAVGVGLALAQQYGGFIRLGGNPANLSVTAYPVKVEVSDLFIVFAIVAVVAAAASLTTRIFTKKID